MKRVVFALAAVVAAWTASAGDSVVLVRNGQPTAEIVVAPDATKAARFGARELAAHVKAMTGADLPCVTPEKHDRSKSAVYIGFCAPVEVLGFRAGSCGPQQYVLACRGNAIVLAGRDKPDSGDFKLEYGDDVNDVALEGHPNAFAWPQIFEERGSLNAVYDFLRDACGVTWADPTDTGTVLKKTRDLVIRRFDDRLCEPFVRCRASGLRWGYKPEIWRPDTMGWTNYMRVAYARAWKRRAYLQNIEAQKRLFLLRQKVGGELIVANHSFYPWYERFWQKDAPNFESYHPEYFARGLGMGKSSGKEIAGGYDASEKPPQLCYSNPSVVSQAVADIRAYFDEGGYRKRFCTINAPGMHWGENNYAVEPMDNHGFCRCANCVRQYHPERSTDRGEQSDYVFRFVKSVADEVAKTHPDKRLSTLAYMSREGVPREVRLPDNVIVHFTFHGNRMPNDPLLEQQEGLLRKWRAEYPKNDFGVWLYDCFPEYMAYRRGFNCFPGFFSKLLASEYAFLKEMDVRACIFYDGMTDDFENYLSFAWMWDPDMPLKALKDRYFASFGAAEKPIRAYYDLVESRFCDKALYAGRIGHQTKEMAWKILGDDETMAKLRGLVVAAAKAPGLTERERRRVHQWKAGYWDYMYSGKHTPTPLPSDRPGVTAVKTEHLWTKAPPSFGPSVLAGVPAEIVQSDPRNYLVSPETGNRMQARTSTSVLTDGDLETTFFIDSKAPVAKYILRKPIEGLSKVRLQVTTRDSARARFRLRLIGLVAGKELPLSPWIEQKTWFSPDKTQEPGRENWTTYDFAFAPGSVPARIEALGIEDETPALGAHWPRLAEIEAR